MKLRVLLALSALGLTACTPDWAKENTSSLIMRIVQVVGTPGSTGGPPSGPGVLFSDVVSDTGFFNDNATLTVDILRKNLDAPSTPLEDVTLTRYEVQYYRTDGRNVEGRDVPFRTTGALTQVMHAPSTTAELTQDISVVVVRHQAKLESPLLELRNFGGDSSVPGSNPQLAGAGILTCIARITVYGESVNGRSLSATGELMVTFANFGG
jgi:hypothetical protein